MRTYVKIMSICLCTLMLIAAVSAAVHAANGPTGTEKSATEEIKIRGQGTGVYLTQYALSAGSVYADSVAGLVNVIEIDPNNPNVALKVLNCGSYTWERTTMADAAMRGNDRSSQGMFVAAMNGDPWIVYHTDYDGDGVAATGPAVKHVSVSRGLLIKGGELWATAQISDENYLAKNDNVERGTPAANQPIFGVKEDGTAVIGCPSVSIEIENTTAGQKTKAAGLNRLPAPNSTILYNHRVGESMAYEDAYEIYLYCSINTPFGTTAFGIGDTVTGKVTHIFESGDTSERPALDARTVVISARGKAIDEQKGKYAVGDTVEFKCSVTSDKMRLSEASEWYSVKEATGGFYTLIEKGVHKGQELDTNYPCTIVGVKKDGTIMLIATTTQADGARAACRMKNMQELVEELGCYTAIMFDGGGSTQMVTLEDESFVRRTAASDGKNEVRPVISGLGVWCSGQDVPVTNSEKEGIRFLDGLGMNSSTGEVEDTSGPHLEGDPSWSYYYVGNVSHVNGKGVNGTDDPYTELVGMRNPGYSSDWPAEQKESEARQPATLDGSTLTLGEDCMLTISGYAFANGSQKKIIYSLDQKTWYVAKGGTYADAPSALVEQVMANGWIKTASAGNAVFENVGVDLSEYQGQTVTVSFAVTPGADDKALHFLTIENVVVPAPADSTEEVTEPATEAPTEQATEPVTQAQTQAPAEQVPEQSTAPEEKGGCNSSVFGGALVIACITLGAVMIKKRRG